MSHGVSCTSCLSFKQLQVFLSQKTPPHTHRPARWLNGKRYLPPLPDDLSDAPKPTLSDLLESSGILWLWILRPLMWRPRPFLPHTSSQFSPLAFPNFLIWSRVLHGTVFVYAEVCKLFPLWVLLTGRYKCFFISTLFLVASPEHPAARPIINTETSST